MLNPTGYGLAVAGSNPYTTFFQPFPHLLDFFFSAGTAAPGTSTQLHRLLEYIGVPSQFTCAEIQASPSIAQGNPGTHAFHPPFNRISTYREPGRINLYTIYTPDVLAGLMNGFPGTNWATFVQSRRGSAFTNTLLDLPNASSPTEFAQPFRSYGGGQMVPLTSLLPTREVNATLLREDPTGAGHPLFQYDDGAQVDDTTRNPFFRYQGLERLGNLVTTRSNVYAVWITVGYFEVLPNPGGIDVVHPDGYQLGRELGIDTGEIERHRAFYIFDRTIPVGFQRGQDLNTDKAILVNRYIE